MQLASIIVLIERRLAKRLKVRSGFDGRLLSLDVDAYDENEAWYIRVEERDTLQHDAEGDAMDLTSGDTTQFPRQQPPPVVPEVSPPTAATESQGDDGQPVPDRRRFTLPTRRETKLFGLVELKSSRENISLTGSPRAGRKRHNFLRSALENKLSAFPRTASLPPRHPTNTANTALQITESSLAPDYAVIDVHNLALLPGAAESSEPNC